MQRISREQARKHAFDWRDEPLLRVRPGESFEVETYDASTGYFRSEEDRAIPALRPAAGIVRSRFEEFSGSGYPRQLAGDEIPMASRVLSVADSYDAMRCPRPFRDALTHEQAINELVRGSGTQFDPDVVRAFTRLSVAG